MRRRRWRWSCWLCPAFGWSTDGIDAAESFERHYAMHHMTEENE